MSDPNLTFVQDPWIWFVSADLDPTASEPVIDSYGIYADPNWFFPWWNRATDNVFLCTDNTAEAMVWKRFITLDSTRLYTAASVDFDAPRVPSIIKETIVIASISMQNTLSTTSTITVQVDNGGEGIFSTVATLGMSGIEGTNTQSVTFNVPVRSQYQFVQSGTGANQIISVQELPL